MVNKEFSLACVSAGLLLEALVEVRQNGDDYESHDDGGNRGSRGSVDWDLDLVAS